MRRKRIVGLSLVVLALCLGQPAKAENNFKIGLYGLESQSVQQFQQNHPDITLISDVPPNTTDGFINAFLTDGFDFDVFPMITSICDVKVIASKGYLADLSGDREVELLADSLNPAVRDQIMLDGKIYAVPSNIQLNYISYNPEAWVKAGFDASDVPDTFGEFLDLLERWIAHVRKTNERKICVYGNFDESLYHESSYTRWLTGLLLENTIMQQSYAGQVMTFDTPTFRTLLERCQTIGHELYEVEEAPTEEGGRMPLLENNSMDISNLSRLLSLRMDEQQPKLISADLWMTAAYAQSNQIDLAAEFAVNHLQYERSSNPYAELLFENPQPVLNPDYEASIAKVRDAIDDLQQQMDASDDLSAEALGKLQERMDRYRIKLEEVSSPERAYLIPEADLEVFRTFGDQIYFQRPSVFAVGTENGKILEQLIDRYAAGMITVDQFIQRLEEVSWMMQMEEGLQ